MFKLASKSRKGRKTKQSGLVEGEEIPLVQKSKGQVPGADEKKRFKHSCCESSCTYADS